MLLSDWQYFMYQAACNYPRVWLINIHLHFKTRVRRIPLFLRFNSHPDTPTELPNVNNLIGATLLERMASTGENVEQATLILSTVFNVVYWDSEWCKVLNGTYSNSAQCNKFVEDNGRRVLVISSAKNQDYTELFSKEGP